jgi:hypothetical protein
MLRVAKTKHRVYGVVPNAAPCACHKILQVRARVGRGFIKLLHPKLCKSHIDWDHGSLQQRMSWWWGRSLWVLVYTCPSPQSSVSIGPWSFPPLQPLPGGIQRKQRHVPLDVVCGTCYQLGMLRVVKTKCRVYSRASQPRFLCLPQNLAHSEQCVCWTTVRQSESVGKIPTKQGGQKDLVSGRPMCLLLPQQECPEGWRTWTW